MEISYEMLVMIAGALYCVGAVLMYQLMVSHERNKKLQAQLREARKEMWRAKWAQLY